MSIVLYILDLVIVANGSWREHPLEIKNEIRLIMFRSSYLVVKFQSLDNNPISGGKSVMFSLPEMWRVERLVSSHIVGGIHLMLLLLTSSLLRFGYISLCFEFVFSVG